MLNLIRSDLYKAFHMKSFYVCGIFPFIFSLLELFLSDKNTMFHIQEQVGLAGGISLSIMFSIFISLFITSEYKNGYIKNIAGNLPDRAMLLISKLALCAVVLLIYFSVHLIINVFLYDIFYVMVYDGYGFITFLGQSGMLLFLNFALGALISFFCIAAQNSGASITMAFLIGSSFLAQSIMMTVQILQFFDIISMEFEVHKYFTTTYIQSFAYGWIAEEAGMALIVGGVYLALSVILTIFHLKKKDI